MQKSIRVGSIQKQNTKWRRQGIIKAATGRKHRLLHYFSPILGVAELWYKTASMGWWPELPAWMENRKAEMAFRPRIQQEERNIWQEFSDKRNPLRYLQKMRSVAWLTRTGASDGDIYKSPLWYFRRDKKSAEKDRHLLGKFRRYLSRQSCQRQGRRILRPGSKEQPRICQSHNCKEPTEKRLAG